jgi:glycosyltransferase involved in cell wall biosynthesis
MKLAILGCRGFPSTYGGYETMVRYVARDWVERGHDVTVYCRTREADRRSWLVDGVRCVWTPGYESKSVSTLSFGATAHIDAAVRGYDAALVLNIANGYYLPLLRARGIPSVVNTDGIEWERGKWGSLARRTFYQGALLAARFADELVADSRAIAEIWAQLFGVTPRFIPYGAPVLESCGHDRVDALGLAPGTYALIVARLIPENNVELALDALGAMGERRPAVVVGSANGGSRLELRLRDLDHSGDLRWLRHVEDQQLLTQLWAHCGAYVHGHSVGGTNPSLLQALGAGAPTLALDTPFNREVIDSHEQLFAPDASDLQAKLGRLLDSPAAQHRFGRRGQAVIAERYRWQDVSNAYLDALVEVRARRDLAAARRRRRPQSAPTTAPARARSAAGVLRPRLAPASAERLRRSWPGGPRVAFLHGSNDTYGASRVLVEDVRVLRSLGWQVNVLLPADGPLTALLEDAGADVEVRDLRVLRRAALAGTRLPVSLPRTVGEADLVVAWTLALASYLPALALAGKATVCSVHEIQPGRAGTLLARGASLLSDGLMANSTATADWLSSCGGSRAQPLVAYPVAPPFDPLPPPPDEGPFGLLLAGRLNGHKGHLEAVGACRLARAEGLDLQLTLLGAPYPGQEAHLHALLEQIDGEPWVSYQGEVDVVRPYLADAHAMLVPTTKPEPFGIVALEAWAAGRLVLASDVGGLSEAADMVGGVKFPPGDVQAMARVLIEVAARRGKTIGMDGSAPAATLCSLSRRAAAWRELLEAVAASRRHRGPALVV